MRLLFVGDVVGRPGRNMLEARLPKLRQKYKPQVTIVNGENAASGKGITEKIYKNILGFGAQVVTLGNHTWARNEIFSFINDETNIIRPLNYPPGAPGRGQTSLNVNGLELVVINAMGRTFMEAIDCPFQALDKAVEEAKKRTPFVFVDFHGEATSEKQAMGWFLDGRASAVIGTHTHVQTADERILPGGTAFLTDVGMTGPYDGILGVDRDVVLKKFQTSLPAKFEVAKGRSQLNAAFMEFDDKTGKARKIERILINDDHPFDV
ncbi:TIGR00282 family metallophosphoesterase [Salicibibacter kimchii]|uniref:TIGR00282 family metallophosphoesterase n=1 Tax=Salicibibacter kimchii TaxID=2099786 RepID=A0A345C3Q8_9BACI|nr:TIGR00282 family metallophosphoesterase [Salicibibacter kimchii]AXF57839.1 TIGR00282 family metallophosphoesterase [Salicibibacter kimchii]